MQVSFKNPTAATLPLSDLANMSHAQLLQCANVLHAGWTSANQKAGTLERERGMVEGKLRSKVDGLEEEVRVLTQSLVESKSQYSALYIANKDAMTELISLRRTANLAREAEAAGSPPPTREEVEALKEQLLYANADLLKLERSLRSRTTLDAKILQERVRILEEQRHQKIKEFQEKDVELELMRLKQANMAEEISQLQQMLNDVNSKPSLAVGKRSNAPAPRIMNYTIPSSAVLPPHSQSPNSDAEDAMSVASGPFEAGQSFSTEINVKVAGEKQFSNRTTQTDGFLVKALDMLDKANIERAELQTLNAELTSRVEELAAQVERVKLDNKTTAEQLAKKDEFINRLIKPTVHRSPSVSENGEGDQTSQTLGLSMTSEKLSTHSMFQTAERNWKKELEDQIVRLKGSKELLEKQLSDSTSKSLKLESDVKQLSKSVSLIAEENAKLTFEIQQLTGLTPHQVEDLFKSQQEVKSLRERMANIDVDAKVAEATQGDLQQSHKEIAQLNARVSKYQIEISNLTIKKEHLQKELVDVYAISESYRKRLEQSEMEVKTLAEFLKGGPVATGGATIGGGTRKPADHTKAFYRRIGELLVNVVAAVVKNYEEKTALYFEASTPFVGWVVDNCLALMEEQQRVQTDEQSSTNLLVLLRKDKASLGALLDESERNLSTDRAILGVRTSELQEAKGMLDELQHRLSIESEVHDAVRRKAGDVENKYRALLLNHERLQSMHRELTSQYSALADFVRSPSFAHVAANSEREEDDGDDDDDNDDAQRLRGPQDLPRIALERMSQSSRLGSIQAMSRSSSAGDVRVDPTGQFGSGTNASLQSAMTRRPPRSEGTPTESPLMTELPLVANAPARVPSLGLLCASHADDSGQSAVWVDTVVRGGVAYTAGLHSGDVILAVNGIPVFSLQDFGSTVESLMHSRLPSISLTVRPKGGDPTVREEIIIPLAA